jgi:DNA gyrase subunit A
LAKRGKEQSNSNRSQTSKINAYIAGSGSIAKETITETLEKNYMPYAMSVIVSRAIPEIDGFKPSHRKLLYTMYKMGLLTGAKTKSANIVGQTMKLNPHGDSAIYETMVRLSKGNEALLHPFVESKGNFGKTYSRDMAYAASRYTEAKLSPIAAELFRDINSDTVDFVPNYDNETTEPTLFPVTFPSVLVNSNVGIAVSMASNVCSFNLSEVCDTTVALIKNPKAVISDTLKGPDFPGGGYIVFDADETEKIIATGRGGFKIRSKWRFDKESNCIEVVEIPPTATVEAIKDKVVELVKDGKIQGVSYIRDETDINGLRIAIDIKRGTDPEKLMKKLFKVTQLEDSYPCNFNILIGGVPRVMGIREILTEWTAFRKECVKRRVYFNLTKKKALLHLLRGLQKILLDIDRAIEIVRETEDDSEVIPNLMIGFGIDETQAEYVAEIKLRNLNKQYILNRLKEVDELKAQISDLDEILGSDRRIYDIIIEELKDVKKRYGQPRKTEFIYEVDSDEPEEDETPDYPVTVFLTSQGYFKKITPLSLRNSGEQKLKEGDSITEVIETTNRAELLFFSDKAQVYKSKCDSFADTKVSVMGDFIPSKLGFDEGESLFDMVVTTDYSGYLIFVFENGKVAKVSLDGYVTVTNRKKLMKAYSEKSKLVKIFHITDNTEILLSSDIGKSLVFNTGMLAVKSTKNTEGVAVMTVKKGRVCRAEAVTEETRPGLEKLVVKNIPVAGFGGKILEETLQTKFNI